MKNLENRSETEAISLLKNGICAICLHPVECTGTHVDEMGPNTDYECGACGHSFTLMVDEEYSIETLEFGVGRF